MPYKKPKIEKIQYTIGEVAEMFGLNVSKVRYWESHFDILNTKRNKKGNRLFSKEDVKIFGMIYNLVEERGMTLDGAAQKIKTNPEACEENYEVIRKLEDIKEFLIEIKTKMEGKSYEA